MKPERIEFDGIVENTNGTIMINHYQVIAEIIHIIRFMIDCMVKINIQIIENGHTNELVAEGSLSVERAMLIVNGKKPSEFLYQNLSKCIGAHVKIMAEVQNMGLDPKKWSMLQINSGK